MISKPLINDLTGQPLGNLIDNPVTYQADSREARALFVSPSGKGSSFLLEQHSDFIGRKNLELVAVSASMHDGGVKP